MGLGEAVPVGGRVLEDDYCKLAKIQKRQEKDHRKKKKKKGTSNGREEVRGRVPSLDNSAYWVARGKEWKKGSLSLSTGEKRKS